LLAVITHQNEYMQCRLARYDELTAWNWQISRETERERNEDGDCSALLCHTRTQNIQKTQKAHAATVAEYLLFIAPHTVHTNGSS